MERHEKQQKTKGRFSEILRCMLYAVVIVFLASCNAFLFLEQQQMKQRLAAIDDEMNTFERSLKKAFPTRQNNGDEQDERLDAKALLVREKRALALSLESLEKRLKVLEFR